MSTKVAQLEQEIEEIKNKMLPVAYELKRLKQAKRRIEKNIWIIKYRENQKKV